MNFDPLSSILGKRGAGGPIGDVVSYLMGRAVGAAREIWKTITNVAVATFTAVSATLRELVIDVTPVQSGSGDPSPSNPRPIIGWTGANINRAAKGIIPIDYAEISRTNFNITVTKKTIRKDWVERGTNQYFLAQIADAFTEYDNLPAGFYSFKGVFKSNRTPVDNGVYARFSDVSGDNYVDAILNGPAVWVNAGWRLNTIYADRGDAWIAGDWATLTDYGIGINLNIYTVSWQTEAGTVYGGTLTDNGDGTWTLTSSWRVRRIRDFTWVREKPNNFDFYRFRCDEFADRANGVQNVLCSVAKTTTATSTAGILDGEICGAASNVGVFIRYDALESVEAFLSVFGDGLIVYRMRPEAEQTYTLTAESVRALIGQNNLFADTGNINTVTYRES